MTPSSMRGEKTFSRGFELALRLLAGESFDVHKLQTELNVSRSTAYRYWRVVRDYRSYGIDARAVAPPGAADGPAAARSGSLTPFVGAATS